MKRNLWFEKLIGKPLPDGLRNIVWQGDGQQHGNDSLGNYWIRDDPREMYLSVDSAYRIRIYMTLALYVEENGLIRNYDWCATFASHGRPSSVTPQVREANQVARLIKPLFAGS